MTNDEIEKRFKMELELGLFKENKYGRIDFKPSTNSFKLYKLLSKIGYIEDSNLSNIKLIKDCCKRRKVYVSILSDKVKLFAWNRNIKNVYFGETNYYDTYYNNIPRYITKYSLNDDSKPKKS